MVILYETVQANPGAYLYERSLQGIVIPRAAKIAAVAGLTVGAVYGLTHVPRERIRAGWGEGLLLTGSAVGGVLLGSALTGGFAFGRSFQRPASEIHEPTIPGVEEV